MRGFSPRVWAGCHPGGATSLDLSKEVPLQPPQTCSVCLFVGQVFWEQGWPGGNNRCNNVCIKRPASPQPASMQEEKLPAQPPAGVVELQQWVACDACSKWRRVPAAVAESLDDDAAW